MVAAVVSVRVEALVRAEPMKATLVPVRRAKPGSHVFVN
jgi:hypothetical protein